MLCSHPMVWRRDVVHLKGRVRGVLQSCARASNLARLPPTVRSNRANAYGGIFCLPWRIILTRRIKSKTYGSLTYGSLTYGSSFSPFYPCLRQNANITLSLQLPMKFGNIVRVETSIAQLNTLPFHILWLSCATRLLYDSKTN